MRIRAYAFTPGVPPTEAPLWRTGDNPTDYGVHRWTERSAERVWSRYVARGNRLQIDIEHSAAEEHDPDELPVLGGYADLEIRDGAPHLVRIDWSAPGVEQIETRQRLYLSPEYDVDESGEIVALTRVSLVGDPATHHARILASAAGGKNSNMDPVLLAALEAAAQADDPKAALEALLASLKKPADEPAPPDSVEAAGAPMDEEEVKASTDEEEKPVMAKAPAPAPAPVKASALASAAPDALRRLEARLDASERDRLLAARGAELDESVRIWASAQPLKTVQSFLDALPRPAAGATRVAATRGAAQGSSSSDSRGLQGDELREFERLARVRHVAASMPRRDEHGQLVVHNITPSEVRRIKAEAAKKVAG